MKSLVPITMSEVTFSEGASYTHVLPENHNAFLYILSGELEFGGSKTILQKTGVATLTFNEEGTGDSELLIKANKRSKVLIYSGVPIKEETVVYGPFVMNTMEEINQAYKDYHEGKFGAPAVR